MHCGQNTELSWFVHKVLGFKGLILKRVSTFSGNQANGTDPCADTVILSPVTSHSKVCE